MQYAYAPNAAGSVTFPKDNKQEDGAVWPLPAGDYVVYLLENDGYTILVQTEFSVTATSSSGKTINDIVVKNAVYQRTSTMKGGAGGTITITPADVVQGVPITGYVFYWANKDGRCENYTELGSIRQVTSGSITFKIDEGIVYPKEATAIHVHAVSGADISTSYFAIDLGNPETYADSELLYRFQVLTDMHIKENAASDSHNRHLQTALKTILRYAPDSSAIFTIGDNADMGWEWQYQKVRSIIDRELAGTNIPVYYTIGNHDYNSGTVASQKELFKKYLDMDQVYSSVEINGATFIRLGSENGSFEQCYADLSDTQLTWLEGELARASQSGSPIFLFLHQPLKETTSGSLESIDPVIQDWHGVKQNDQLRSILDKYPQVIMFTGHTHWTFDSLQPVPSGLGKTANYVNAASVGYLWNDLDKTEPGSEGLFVEVYKDYVLVKGYEFEENKWSGRAQYLFAITTGTDGEDGGDNEPSDGTQTPSDETQNPSDGTQTPSDGTQKPSEDTSTDASNTGGTIAIIVAIVMLLAGAAAAVFVILKKKRMKQ